MADDSKIPLYAGQNAVCSFKPKLFFPNKECIINSPFSNALPYVSGFRFLMVPSLHPDWTLLLFFIHTHITITMTLALLFIPKV